MTIVTAITHRITGGILLMASPHAVSIRQSGQESIVMAATAATPAGMV
jgi:hypothetical protein